MEEQYYLVDGERFTITDDQVTEFLSDFPEAQRLNVFEVDDESFYLTDDQVTEFRTDFPEARALYVNEDAKVPESQSIVDPNARPSNEDAFFPSDGNFEDIKVTKRPKKKPTAPETTSPPAEDFSNVPSPTELGAVELQEQQAVVEGEDRFDATPQGTVRQQEAEVIENASIAQQKTVEALNTLSKFADEGGEITLPSSEDYVREKIGADSYNFQAESAKRPWAESVSLLTRAGKLAVGGPGALYSALIAGTENRAVSEFNFKKRNIGILGEDIQQVITMTEEGLTDRYGSDFLEQAKQGNEEVINDAAFQDYIRLSELRNENAQNYFQLLEDSPIAQSVMAREQEIQRQVDERNRQTRDIPLLGKAISAGASTTRAFGQGTAKFLTDLATAPATLRNAAGFETYSWVDAFAQSFEDENERLKRQTIVQPSRVTQGVFQNIAEFEGKQVVVDEEGNPIEVRDEDGYLDMNVSSEFLERFEEADPEAKLRFTNSGSLLVAAADTGTQLFYTALGTKGLGAGAKALGMSNRVASNLGTFTTTMIQTQRDAYNEALQAGMSPEEAGRYGLMSGSISGAVSLIGGLEQRLAGATASSVARKGTFNTLRGRALAGKLNKADRMRLALSEGVSNALGELKEETTELLAQNGLKVLYGADSGLELDGAKEVAETLVMAPLIGFSGGTSIRNKLPDFINSSILSATDNVERFSEIADQMQEQGVISEKESADLKSDVEKTAEQIKALPEMGKEKRTRIARALFDVEQAKRIRDQVKTPELLEQNQDAVDAAADRLREVYNSEDNSVLIEEDTEEGTQEVEEETVEEEAQAEETPDQGLEEPLTNYQQFQETGEVPRPKVYDITNQLEEGRTLTPEDQEMFEASQDEIITYLERRKDNKLRDLNQKMPDTFQQENPQDTVKAVFDEEGNFTQAAIDGLSVEQQAAARNLRREVDAPLIPDAPAQTSDARFTIPGVDPENVNKERSSLVLSLAQRLDEEFFGNTPRRDEGLYGVSSEAGATAALYNRVIERFAQEMGEAPTDVLNKFIGKIQRTTSEELTGRQKMQGKRMGATQRSSFRAPAVISALEDANKSTALHELAHVFEDWIDVIDENARGTVLNAYNEFARENDLPEQTEWDFENVSEFFANSWERFLQNPNSAPTGLETLFDKFRQWLVDLYKGALDFRGNELNVSSEMQTLFESIVADPDEIAQLRAQQSEQAQETQTNQQLNEEGRQTDIESQQPEPGQQETESEPDYTTEEGIKQVYDSAENNSYEESKARASYHQEGINKAFVKEASGAIGEEFSEAGLQTTQEAIQIAIKRGHITNDLSGELAVAITASATGEPVNQYESIGLQHAIARLRPTIEAMQAKVNRLEANEGLTLAEQTKRLELPQMRKELQAQKDKYTLIMSVFNQSGTDPARQLAYRRWASTSTFDANGEIQKFKRKYKATDKDLIKAKEIAERLERESKKLKGDIKKDLDASRKETNDLAARAIRSYKKIKNISESAIDDFIRYFSERIQFQGEDVDLEKLQVINDLARFFVASGQAKSVGEVVSLIRNRFNSIDSPAKNLSDDEIIQALAIGGNPKLKRKQVEREFRKLERIRDEIIDAQVKVAQLGADSDTVKQAVDDTASLTSTVLSQITKLSIAEIESTPLNNLAKVLDTANRNLLTGKPVDFKPLAELYDLAISDLRSKIQSDAFSRSEKANFRGAIKRMDSKISSLRGIDSVVFNNNQKPDPAELADFFGQSEKIINTAASLSNSKLSNEQYALLADTLNGIRMKLNQAYYTDQNTNAELVAQSKDSMLKLIEDLGMNESAFEETRSQYEADLETISEGRLVDTSIPKEAKPNQAIRQQAKVQAIEEELRGEEARLATKDRIKDWSRSLPFSGGNPLGDKIVDFLVLTDAIRKGTWEIFRRLLFSGDASSIGIQGGFALMGAIGKAPIGLGAKLLDYLGVVPNQYGDNLLGEFSGVFKAIMAGALAGAQDFSPTDPAVETKAEAIYLDMIASNMGQLARQSGVIFNRPGGGITSGEEIFVNNTLSTIYTNATEAVVDAVAKRFKNDKVKKVVKGSKVVLDFPANFLTATETFFTTHLNHLALNAFSAYRTANPEATKEELKRVSDFINNSVGRANVAFPNAINQIGAAPKYHYTRIRMAGRIAAAPAQGLLKYKNSAVNFVAREVGYMMMGQLMLHTLLRAFGWEQETDPRSREFLKYKKGTERLDPTFGTRWGFRLPVYMAARLGEETGYDWTEQIWGTRDRLNEQFNPMLSSSYALIGQELTYKLHPAIGSAMQLAEQSNIIGRPLGKTFRDQVTNYATSVFLPLGFQTVLREKWDVGETIIQASEPEDPVLKRLLGFTTSSMGVNILDFKSNHKHVQVENYLKRLNKNVQIDGFLIEDGDSVSGTVEVDGEIISGAPIRIYELSENGIVLPESDNLVAETSSAEDGSYSFDNLPTGRYYAYVGEKSGSGFNPFRSINSTKAKDYLRGEGYDIINQMPSKTGKNSLITEWKRDVKDHLGTWVLEQLNNNTYPSVTEIENQRNESMRAITEEYIRYYTENNQDD